MWCPSEPSLRAGAFHDWLGTQGGSGVRASLNSGRKRSVIGSEDPRAEVPCRACRHYGRKLSARAGLGSGRAAEARCRNEGRSSSPPLGPPRGLSPSEGGAAAEGRKAAAGVLQSQVSQEKEQADCPDRRKALSREMEKELIIPLPHPVRPEDGNYSATAQSSDSEKPTSSIRSPRRDGRTDRRTPLFALPARGRGERPGREPHRSPPPRSPAQQFNKVCFPACAPFGGCHRGKWLSPSVCGCRFRSGVGVEGGGGPVSTGRWMLTTPRSAGPALPGGGAARCCLCSPGWGDCSVWRGLLAEVQVGRGLGVPSRTPRAWDGVVEAGSRGIGGWGRESPGGGGMGWQAQVCGCWAAGGEAWGWLCGVCSVKPPGAPFPQQAGSCGHWALSIPLPMLGSLLLSPCLFCPDKKCTVSACRRSASQP
ncbi:uncharacterized protein [Anser cygnoides]|uniref:uncharacterized protein isoform X2 n=1 Tax=Anser cygnoides TaxID=8845 RepID=UPI0034D2950C